MKSKLFEKLKTEGASFGFSEEEIDRVAELLSVNLTSESNEEELAKVVGQGLGLMKLSQSAISRSVNKKLESLKPKEVEKKEQKQDVELNAETLKAIIAEATKPLQDEIQSLKGVNVLKTREERLNVLYKDLSKENRDKLLSQTEYISFDNDEAFDKYIESQKGIVESMVQKEGASRVNSIGQVGQTTSPEDLPDENQVREMLGIKKRD